MVNAISRSYIVNVNLCFETFLKDMDAEIKCFGKKAHNAKDPKESWLECVVNNVVGKLPKEYQKLYELCNYYRLVRNTAVHDLRDVRTLDKKFKKDIKKNNTDLFNYFKNSPYIYADKNGNTVDVYHMAATMCGLYHKTSGSDGNGFVDFVQFQFMPEYHYDNLCGWAGDLQTLMNDADKSDKEKEKSYDEFKKRLDKKSFYPPYRAYQ